MSSKPSAKEVTVSKRAQKAAQQADYKWMAEHGLSPEAKRYRDEHIRPKKRVEDEDGNVIQS